MCRIPKLESPFHDIYIAELSLQLVMCTCIDCLAKAIIHEHLPMNIRLKWTR